LEEAVRRRVSVDDFKQADDLLLRLTGQRNVAGGEGQWWVCDEYKYKEDAIVATIPLDENWGRWRIYRPLEEAPDLFLKFARLHEASNFEEAALHFSHKYGLLHHWDQQQEGLSDFRYETKRAWVTLVLYEFVLSGDACAVGQLVSEVAEVQPDPTRAAGDVEKLGVLFWLFTDEDHGLFRERTDEEKRLAFASVATEILVGRAVRQLCYLALDFEEFSFPPDLSKIRSVVGFENLLGAIYLQMYWLMASGGDVTRCEYCGRIISLARPHPEGRKRRRDKRFCDDACRQANHRSKKQA
jgi:hypothetical protein